VLHPGECLAKPGIRQLQKSQTVESPAIAKIEIFAIAVLVLCLAVLMFGIDTASRTRPIFCSKGVAERALW
jgi:hypothetical protein